jgi:subtilisin family serine protease
MFARLPLAATLLLALALVLPSAGQAARPALAQESVDPAGLPVGPIYTADAPATQADLAPRWIVQLSGPPLAQWPGDGEYAIQSLRAPDSGRLAVGNVAAQDYIAQLAAQQQALFAQLQQIFPRAELQRQYQVVFNGIAVALPGTGEEAAAQLSALPGVARVYADLVYDKSYSSIAQIGADALWASPAIGGQQNAGAGVKIAVIDEGIAIGNPFFNPEGFSYPEGFPKGDAAHTSPKVIAARAYFRPDAPPLPGSETPQPGPEDSSHGTHVAGIAAGVANTLANTLGVERTIAGVAPRAHLLNYKAFYSNNTPFSGSAFGVELIAALEDAVSDGADVINNSWGGRGSVNPWADPITIAADAAADAGVVVVFSAGNSGPNPNTAGSPSYSDKLIAVGAVTTPETIAAGLVEAIAPEGVPSSIQAKAFGRAAFGPPIEIGSLIGPATYRPAGEGEALLACAPLPEGQLAGQIALIERGACTFSLKVFHAQEAGATAAIVFNSAEGGEGLISMGPGERADEVRIPSVSVARSVGLGLLDWLAQHGDAALVQIDGRPRVIGQSQDVLAGFSSRGPSFQGSLKPDLVAPGVGILSSGFAEGGGGAQHLGFGISSGTSMAAPQVAGAAALLRQLNPGWTTADVKSALMATAIPDVWLDQERTQPASVLERGAGRIDVVAAANPGLLFDRPSLSFDNLLAVSGQPSGASATIVARNSSGQRQSYQLSARPTGGSALGLSVSPASITLGPGEQASFSVAIEIPAGGPVGSYSGEVVLDGGARQLRLPVWARNKPADLGAKVLLLDNDGSSSLGFPDYAGYFGNLLVEQNISFVHLDADALAPAEQTLPGLGELQRYEIVLWFTGDNYVPSGALQAPTPLTEADQELLIQYLQAGGNLIATGQNLAEASDISIDPPDDPRYGRSTLFGGYLGAIFVQENVFTETSTLERTVVGTGAQPWLGSLQLDLRPLGEDLRPSDQTSAGNQESVDEIALSDIDPRQPELFATPILRASGAGLEGGIVAMNQASSPTLEAPQPGLPYRSTYLAFGLEGIRSDSPGFTTRKELLQQILYWTIDRPSVQLVAPPEAGVGGEASFSAQAQTNTPTSFVRYRWDFGDGSPVVETGEPGVGHSFAQAGSYRVRVEATDGWGHRALGEAEVIVTGSAAGAASEQAEAPVRPLAAFKFMARAE